MAAVSLTEAFSNINLANNGYVFESNLCVDYLRRTKALVDRGVVVVGKLKNASGKIEVAYFTLKSAEIYNHLLNRI